MSRFFLLSTVLLSATAFADPGVEDLVLRYGTFQKVGNISAVQEYQPPNNVWVPQAAFSFVDWPTLAANNPTAPGVLALDSSDCPTNYGCTAQLDISFEIDADTANEDLMLIFERSGFEDVSVKLSNDDCLYSPQDELVLTNSSKEGQWSRTYVQLDGLAEGTYTLSFAIEDYGFDGNLLIDRIRLYVVD